MKITCSELDDLLLKEEYLEQLAKSNLDRQNDSNLQYEADIQKLTSSARSYLESELSIFNLLRFSVEIFWRNASSTVHVAISAIENSKSRKKLRWSIGVDVKLPEGDVYKEVSAWKGLEDCTPDKIAAIKQSTEAVELLNTVDWYSLLNMQYPDYQDYDLHLDRSDLAKCRSEIRTAKLKLLKQFQESHALLRPVKRVTGRRYKYPVYFIKDVDATSTPPYVFLLEADGVKHPEFNDIEELYQHALAEGIVDKVGIGSLTAILPNSLDTITKHEYQETRIGDRI